MKQILLICLAFMMTAVSGCGYHLTGGGYLDGEITRVAVEVFENNSSESRAGVRFADELVREITQRTDTKVVNQANATKKISGTVKSITFATLSRSSTETVVERLVTAVVDVKLTGPGGEILWSVKDFSANEPYTTAIDTLEDEAGKAAAVGTIAQRVSERLVSQMKSNF